MAKDTRDDVRDPDLKDQKKRDDKALSLLKSGKWTEAVNSEKYPFDSDEYSPNFDGFEFIDISFVNVEFYGTARNSKFINCTFESCVFDSIHFENSIFENVSATDSIFSCSHFERCKFRIVSFEGCNLEDVWMFNTDMEEVGIRHCRLDEASFDGSLFHDVNLEFSHGHWATFNGVRFFGTQFCKARLMNSSLRNVRLMGPEIWQSENSFEISQDYADDEDNVGLSGADLSNSGFSFASLTGLDFGESDLTNTSFAWCDLTGVDFRKCKGVSAGAFRGSDLTGAKFPQEGMFRDHLDKIERIVALARPAYLFNLITCGALVAVFVFGKPSGGVSLPLFQTNLEPHRFALFGIIQSIIISSYTSIYIIRIFEETSKLPTVLSSGMRIPDAISPWSVLAPVWIHIRVLSEYQRFNLPAGYWPQFTFAIISHWLLTPITALSVAVALWRTDPAFHLPSLAAISISSAFSILSYRRSVQILRADAIFPKSNDNNQQRISGTRFQKYVVNIRSWLAGRSRKI